jgi:hypothetical protein
MKRTIRHNICMAGLLLLSILLPTAAPAQSSPVVLGLTPEKTVVQPNEPIKLQIKVYNNTGTEVITQRGFLAQDFHLMLTFTDPDGKLVNRRDAVVGEEPGPPARLEEEDGALAERLPAGSAANPNRLLVIEDAHAYYDLVKSGRYTARVRSDLETYGRTGDDPELGLIGFLKNPAAEGFDLLSNDIAFEIAAPPAQQLSAAVKVKVTLYQVGLGIRPRVVKKPLENIPVYLIPRSEVPSRFNPINHKVYGFILDHLNFDNVRVSHTDSQGLAKYEQVPRDDYVIIAMYDGSHDFQHMGGFIDADDRDWGTSTPIVKHLQVIEIASGKKIPCRTTRRQGSELLIIEPEVVTWDGTQEVYPFVFETEGDWTVTTTITPPEGFAADQSALTAVVKSETEAVQFTITDVGSRWEETGVTHKIKHKGRIENLRHKIGIKLSKRLAKKKGLGIYGHTPGPGTFKGGKKVGKDN